MGGGGKDKEWGEGEDQGMGEGEGGRNKEGDRVKWRALVTMRRWWSGVHSSS